MAQGGSATPPKVVRLHDCAIPATSQLYHNNSKKAIGFLNFFNFINIFPTEERHHGVPRHLSNQQSALWQA